MTITITAFDRSPDGGRGLARDTRVRWALEEVSQPYDVRLVTFEAMKQPAHLALHPFGQIPTYEEGDLAVFETGAIVLHIAERYAGLLPDDANARTRAITWMFAALNTVEPPILDLVTAKIFEGDKPWAKDRVPLVQDRVRARLSQLSRRLGDADWLDGAFSAGDLMMVSVLLRVRPSGLLTVVLYPWSSDRAWAEASTPLVASCVAGWCRDPSCRVAGASGRTCRSLRPRSGWRPRASG
jgi:glutathione S-transferase